jgi:hypothetical protein
MQRGAVLLRVSTCAAYACDVTAVVNISWSPRGEEVLHVNPLLYSAREPLVGCQMLGDGMMGPIGLPVYKPRQRSASCLWLDTRPTISDATSTSQSA